MKQIETGIDIHASPAAIWETLVDFESYPVWNPFVPMVEGVPEVDEQLRVRIEPPESRGMTFKPRVTAAIPHERLEWLGKLGISGLFDGRHEFRIESIDADTSRFVHRESFSGVLVGLFLNEDSTRAGFESMNKALKARVEGRMRDQDTASSGQISA